MKLMALLAVMVIWMVSSTTAYHILCVFPVPSRSHNHLAKGIVNAMLKAGHQVTWASPYQEKKDMDKMKYIDISATLKLAEGIDMTGHRNDGLAFVKEFAKNVSVITMKSKELREVLVNTNFDAVVTEYFFSDVHAGIAAVQQAPWILLHGMPIFPHLEYLVDEIRSVSTVPLVMMDYPIPMHFWQRLSNTALALAMLFQTWREQPWTIAMYESLFAPLAQARGVPPFSEALHNVSVLLVNSHPSISPAQPLPPNVINVAGYHIDENTPPLPKDLQDLMDSSTKGVIYFSMGSVVKSSELPERTRKELIEVLGELSYTVLWKFEQKIEGLPKNVHTRAWFPQASILAHRNLKLFITHAGGLSTLEALHYGVPLLALPVFGDQPSNAAQARRAGYALSVPYTDDVAPALRVALNEMLANDSYYSTAKRISRLFRRRPLSPSKLIAHYIELAIETKGAYHLRSQVRFYPWYQRWMLDQLAALVLALGLLVYVLVKVTKMALRAILGRKTDKRNKTD